MTSVECRTLYGRTRLIPVEKLIVHPGVYGLVIQDDQLLLLESRTTGKWMQPGGGIHKGETIEAALQREMQEEAGINVVMGELAHFLPDFFYYDPLDLAFQGYLFFYYCTPCSLELNPPNANDEEGIPAWVPIDTLTADSFESHGEVMMTLLRSRPPVQP